MKDRDDRIYLTHILKSIALIERYLEGCSENHFLQDTLIQDGVVRQLIIIGEAVKRLSDGVRTTHPQTPWKDIAGMRDKLVHDYFGVDLDAVWYTTQYDLPPLKAQVEHILRGLGDPS